MFLSSNSESWATTHWTQRIRPVTLRQDFTFSKAKKLSSQDRDIHLSEELHGSCGSGQTRVVRWKSFGLLLLAPLVPSMPLTVDSPFLWGCTGLFPLSAPVARSAFSSWVPRAQCIIHRSPQMCILDLSIRSDIRAKGSYSSNYRFRRENRSRNQL